MKQNATADMTAEITSSRHQSIQFPIAIVVATGWIIYLVYLLTAKISPELGTWAGPPHLTSSIFLAVAVSTVLSRSVASNSLLGWWIIVISSLFIIAFESLQLLVPDRSFQFIDIAQGIAGAAMAAMVCALLSRIIGRSAYTWLAIAAATIALIFSLAFVRIDNPPEEISCARPINTNVDWNTVTAITFLPEKNQQEKNLVASSLGKLCLFDPPNNSTNTLLASSVTDSSGVYLKLSGAGIVSAPLTGLREALSLSGQITFGIRFKTHNLNAGRPPRLIASIQTDDSPPATIARMMQNGPNSSVSFSFQPWQGSSTVLANRLRDRFQEVVMTYDGALQTTYLDGVQIGTETTIIKALETTGSELILSIGRRVDKHWQPFFGEIDSIIISASSISANEIATVFNRD